MSAAAKACLEADFAKKLAKLECSVGHFSCHEKSIATEWITKLRSSNSSLEEMKLRGDFINYLVKCTDGGVFRVPPFNAVPPPCGTLMDIQDLLPPDHKCACMSIQRKRHNLNELFSASSDNGDFISTLPVPRDGVFTVTYYHPPTQSGSNQSLDD